MSRSRPGDSTSSSTSTAWWAALGLGGGALLVALGLGYRLLLTKQQEEDEEEDDDYDDRPETKNRKRPATEASKRRNRQVLEKAAHQPDEKIERLVAIARQAAKSNQHEKAIRACNEALKRMAAIPSYQHTVALAEINYTMYESQLKHEAKTGTPAVNNAEFLKKFAISFSPDVICPLTITVYRAKLVIDTVRKTERRLPHFKLFRTMIYCNMTEMLVQQVRLRPPSTSVPS